MQLMAFIVVAKHKLLFLKSEPMLLTICALSLCLWGGAPAMHQLSPPAIMENQNMPSLKAVSNMSLNISEWVFFFFSLASASVVPVSSPLLLAMIYGQIFMIQLCSSVIWEQEGNILLQKLQTWYMLSRDCEVEGQTDLTSSSNISFLPPAPKWLSHTNIYLFIYTHMHTYIFFSSPVAHMVITMLIGYPGSSTRMQLTSFSRSLKGTRLRSWCSRMASPHTHLHYSSKCAQYATCYCSSTPHFSTSSWQSYILAVQYPKWHDLC